MATALPGRRVIRLHRRRRATTAADEQTENPDAVIYSLRRKFASGMSTALGPPCRQRLSTWGYRREEQASTTDPDPSEWWTATASAGQVQRQESRQFVNATTNLPGHVGPGFHWQPNCSVSSNLSWTGSAAPPTHPLFSDGGRKVWSPAAMRLTMLMDHPQALRRAPSMSSGTAGHPITTYWLSAASSGRRGAGGR